MNWGLSRLASVKRKHRIDWLVLAVTPNAGLPNWALILKICTGFLDRGEWKVDPVTMWRDRVHLLIWFLLVRVFIKCKIEKGFCLQHLWFFNLIRITRKYWWIAWRSTITKTISSFHLLANKNLFLAILTSILSKPAFTFTLCKKTCSNYLQNPSSFPDLNERRKEM
jgi:hypothetical protein